MTNEDVERVVYATLKQIRYKPCDTYSRTEILLNSYNYCKKSIGAKKRAKNAEVRASIADTAKYVEIVDIALDVIAEDKYFGIIVLYYFEGKTLEEIAEIFDKSTQTIFRQRKRLVNILKSVIFADEVIKENFNG